MACRGALAAAVAAARSVAAGPIISIRFVASVARMKKPVTIELTPELVAAGSAAFACGGRRHVSAGAPAATSRLVCFGNSFQRWFFLSIPLGR